jgi:DNA polymerase V
MNEKNIDIELNKLIPVAVELLKIEIPLLGEVAAGFPSEAFNYTEKNIDFNQLLIKHKETTFCLIAGGESMKGDGIFKGDLLVIDKLEEPYDRSIVVFSIDGEFTLKRLEYRGDHVALLSSNPNFPDITIRKGEKLTRWGVLKYSIRKF